MLAAGIVHRQPLHLLPCRVLTPDPVQDFMRRIPSSGTLSAADSFNYLDPAQQAQLQQSVQQIQQQAAQQDDLRRASSGLQEAGTLEVKGFPRVASLDYLQQLVQQSAGPSSAPSKPAPTTSGTRACSARPG